MMKYNATGAAGKDIWDLRINRNGSCKMKSRHKSIRLLFVLIMALLSLNSVRAQNFIRGDADGNGFISLVDNTYILAYLVGGGPSPLDDNFLNLTHSGDVNDNQWITCADHLYHLEVFVCRAPMWPPPLTSGPDPTHDQHGFDRIDTGYEVFSSAEISATSVEVTLEITIPAGTAAKATTLLLEFSPAMLPRPGTLFFVPANAAINHYKLIMGNRVMITILDTQCGTFPAPSPPNNRIRLGTLNFSHTGVSHVPPPIMMKPEMTGPGAFVYRATIVDEDFSDHHPVLMPSTFTQTGRNFNRSDPLPDQTTNIADATLLMNYYLSAFGGTGNPPMDQMSNPLIDAGDVNDNEWITYADVLFMFDHFQDGLPAIPPPPTPPSIWGDDPDNDQRGFDRVDPDFELYAFSDIRSSSLDTLLEISIPPGTQAVGAVVIVKLNPAMMPNTPANFFVPGFGFNGSSAIVGDKAVIYVGNVPPGGSPIPDPVTNRILLGRLMFTHTGVNCIPSPVTLEPQLTTPAGFVYRSTIIDSDYNDHHPMLMPENCTYIPDDFIRGDINADGRIDSSDVQDYTDYFLGATGTAPRDDSGDPLLDAGDVNDNEWITYADILYLDDFLNWNPSMSIPKPAPIPPPNSLGHDPDNLQHGFDSVDPDYEAFLTVNASVVNVNAVVEISVPPHSISAKTEARAATLIVEYNAALTPALPADLFTPAPGVDPGLCKSRVVGNHVMVTVAGHPLPQPYGLTDRIWLGSINFMHTGFANTGCAPMPVTFKPEVTTPNGIIYRATVVDSDYTDHHPTLAPAVHMPFMRGDGNQDLTVDISDVIYILTYLFIDGPAICLNALDANDKAGVDLSDAIYLLTFLFNNGNPPPSPYPVSGPDRTPVPLPCTFYP